MPLGEPLIFSSPIFCLEAQKQASKQTNQTNSRTERKKVSMRIQLKSFLLLHLLHLQVSLAHPFLLLFPDPAMCFSLSLSFSPDWLLRLAASKRHAKGRQSASGQVHIGSIPSVSNLQRGAFYIPCTQQGPSRQVVVSRWPKPP